MKVLFAIDSLGGGGAEHSLAELVPALAADGIDPVVVALEASGGGPERDLRVGCFDARRSCSRAW